MTGKPMTERVYRQLYSDIINGVLTPNDILSEARLSERFEVSKAPVREALITLCAEGLLMSIPRSGYKIVQILPREAEELIELRWALESFLLDKSFCLIDEDALARLEKIHLDNLKEERHLQCVQDNWRRNMRFHLMLASFARNRRMELELARALKDCARASTQYFLGRSGKEPYEDIHGPLIESIRQGRAEQAKGLLKQDVMQLL